MNVVIASFSDDHNAIHREVSHYSLPLLVLLGEHKDTPKAKGLTLRLSVTNGHAK